MNFHALFDARKSSIIQLSSTNRCWRLVFFFLVYLRNGKGEEEKKKCKNKTTIYEFGRLTFPSCLPIQFYKTRQWHSNFCLPLLHELIGSRMLGGKVAR